MNRKSPQFRIGNGYDIHRLVGGRKLIIGGVLLEHPDNLGLDFLNNYSFNKREKRDPIFKALYGLGCISGAHNIKKGKLVSGKIGILPLEEEKFTKRFFH